mgnify:CR=1 FL=1
MIVLIMNFIVNRSKGEALWNPLHHVVIIGIQLMQAGHHCDMAPEASVGLAQGP